MMAGDFSLDGRLGKIVARGASLTGDVAEAVVAASITFSTDELSTLELSLADNDDFKIARTGLFDAGTPTTAGSRIEYRGRKFECRAIELNPRGADNLLKVTARSLVGSRLRRQRGDNQKKGISPTEYLAIQVKAAGGRFVGQASAKRKNVGRTKDETSWTCGQRLATELGYEWFEADDVVYFGKPTWIIGRTLTLPIKWNGTDAGRDTDDAIDALPVCRRTGDDAKRLATVDAQLRGDLGEDALPGMRVELTGVPLFDASNYMVTRVLIPLADRRPVTVSAATAINPKPQPPIKIGGGSADPTSGGAQGTARAFLAYARAQLGDNYQFGAEAAASDPDPNAFDCSELVQWALARAGVAFVDGSAAQIAACIPISVEEGIRTPGALLYSPGHIVISQGDGRTIEAANSRVGVVAYSAAGRFSRAGRVPGLRYG